MLAGKEPSDPTVLLCGGPAVPDIVTAVEQEACVPFHLSSGIWAHGIESADFTGSWLPSSGTRILTQPVEAISGKMLTLVIHVFGLKPKGVLGSASITFH